MKNQSSTRQVFKIKFSKTVVILCIAVLALCGAGIGVSVWRILEHGVRSFADALKSPFLIAVCVFCIVVVICLLIKSQYVVEDERFLTQFGFIKSKFSIKEITSLVLDCQKNKLTMKFGEEFFIVTINPAWQENLVRALLAVNPDIDYSFTLTDAPVEKPDEKNKN